MTKLILWILIPVALITAVLLVYLLHGAANRRRKAKAIDDLSFLIKRERMAKMDALLNRVKVISGMNSKYEPLFNELTRQHTDLEEKINNTFNKFGMLTLNAKSMRLSKFDEEAESIKAGAKIIDSMQHRFEVAAERITQQDEFMAAEIAFYTNNLRKTIGVYRQKRILLDRVAPKLDGLSKKIKALEKHFDKLLDAANISQANIVLNQYSRKVIDFSIIINEGPAVQSYLYVTIPSLVKNLVENYKVKKKEVGGALDHIDFSKSINDIATKYKKAKQNYLNLKLDKAKKAIRNILKSLKILERLINYEIKSRNVFVKNYEDTMNESKKSLNIFVTIRAQIKALSGRGIAIPVELAEEYKKLNTEAKALDQMAVAFRKTMKERELSFSAKVSRMKLLIQKNRTFVVLINEITSSIWALNVEKLIIKNKFRRAEGALNEIIAATKRENIALSDSEVAEFDLLSHNLSKLAPTIAADLTSKEIAENVNNVVEKTISYYQVVGGKIQIAEIIKNLIKEFSPKRAIDLDLNAQLTAAEGYYLRGDYDAALNLIITHLEEAQ